MKTFDLLPTDENIISTLKSDLLRRNESIAHFVTLLDNIEGPFSIALDGKWGSGKTFFVKQAKLVLDIYNDILEKYSSIDSKKIKEAVEKYNVAKEPPLISLKQVTVYYDAWSNDNDIDPILSIMSEILQSINSDFDFKAPVKTKDVFSAVIEFFTNRKIESLLNSTEGEDPFFKLKSHKDMQSLISEFLGSLLPEQGDRLVIFIDELDRCKPSYAVQLLERIKHYFISDQITFVFSVNLTELQHTIKQHYGNDFDAHRYVNRFFDMLISLPPAKTTNYFQTLGLSDNNSYYQLICKEVIKTNKFELREISKFAQIMKIMTPTNISNPLSTRNKALDFSLHCVVPIMMGLLISDITRYNLFIDGKDSSPLIEILTSPEIKRVLDHFFLEKDETFGEPRYSNEIHVDNLKILNEVYDALFVQNYTGNVYSNTVGATDFSQYDRDQLFKVATMLSNFSNYNT